MDLLTAGREYAGMTRSTSGNFCPKCGLPMALAVSPSGNGPRQYRCEQCEQPDPMRSAQASGWLQGELQPPK
jgi:hypothetical protein